MNVTILKNIPNEIPYGEKAKKKKKDQHRQTHGPTCFGIENRTSKFSIYLKQFVQIRQGFLVI